MNDDRSKVAWWWKLLPQCVKEYLWVRSIRKSFRISGIPELRLK